MVTGLEMNRTFEGIVSSCRGNGRSKKEKEEEAEKVLIEARSVY